MLPPVAFGIYSNLYLNLGQYLYPHLHLCPMLANLFGFSAIGREWVPAGGALEFGDWGSDPA